MTTSQSAQGLFLRTAFFAVDWTLNFTRTTIIIDGELQELPWGSHYIPLEPGAHELQVSYPYLRMSRAGKAAIRFDMAAGEIVQASYRAPPSVLVAFRPGRLRLDPGTIRT